MKGARGAGLAGEGPVLVVYPHAGQPVGHHTAWMPALVDAIGPNRSIVLVTLGGVTHAHGLADSSLTKLQVLKVSEDDSITRWYRRALRESMAFAPGCLILPSADEALVACSREWRLLRRAQTRALFLRVAPQPTRWRTLRYAAKIVTLLLLRTLLPEFRPYFLALPVGRTSRLLRMLGMQPVADPSASEVGVPVGRAVARRHCSIPNGQRPVVLVIGMLGPGKHIDTIVDAWRGRQNDGGSLIAAGQADATTHHMLSHANSEIASFDYRYGRLADVDFDMLLEAADVVCCLYRYSASSGVALRALALGTRVLVGGSSTLRRQLRDVDGVTIVDALTPEGVRAGLDAALRREAPSPRVYASKSAAFPLPLIRGL